MLRSLYWVVASEKDESGLAEQNKPSRSLLPLAWAGMPKTSFRKSSDSLVHVLHFDGHGVYDKHKGLGGLCFEKTALPPSERGGMDLVYADKLASLLREHRIPLVFLEACQTAQSEDDAVKSVAAALLTAGIVSVVAMTHSVLVVTAELFVREFYAALAQGQRIGAAMLAAQRTLMADKSRFEDGSGSDFFIEDWFIPVLYQERETRPYFTASCRSVCRIYRSSSGN